MWKVCNVQEQYNGRKKAANLFLFVLEHFLSMLQKRSNSKEKLLLRDGDVSEKSEKVIST